MALVDVLEWLDRRRLRGELSVQRGPSARKLHIVGGDVTGVSSTQPTEHLGPALVEAGLLDDEQLHDAAQRPRGQPLGRHLVDGKILPEETIRPRLESQIRESACDVMAWADGSFLFDPEGPHEWPGEVRATVPLRECLREAAARAQRWPALREQVGGEEARFYCTDPAAAEGDSTDATVLRELGRGPTVRELIALHRTFPYPMYVRLADLLTRGLIRADRRQSVRAVADTELDGRGLIQAADGRATGGDQVGALGLARKAVELAPRDRRVRHRHDTLERELFGALARGLLGERRVPRLRLARAEIEKLNLSAEEKQLVGRIDGCWDLMSLMVGSPYGEVRALVAVKSLESKGVISL